jgi:hypothetical protein
MISWRRERLRPAERPADPVEHLQVRRAFPGLERTVLARGDAEPPRGLLDRPTARRRSPVSIVGSIATLSEA